MEPKFQSSFIPKGPLTAPAGIVPARVKKESSLFGIIAISIFVLALVLSAGAFGYRWFLGYRIASMASDLEAARAAIDPEVIKELSRLDARLKATEDLLESHAILTPLFAYLESATPAAVRFTSFNYTNAKGGLELVMKGQARSYSALALAALIFNRGEYVRNPIFSDLNLDDKGNVTFSVKAGVGPSLVSYRRELEKRGLPAVPAVPNTPAVEASTTSRNVAE